MKAILLTGVLLLLSHVLLVADSKNMSYGGFWADFAPTSEPSYGNTFVAITKISGSDYLVVSASTRDPKHLSFFGKGTLAQDNVLVVRTNTGFTWLFTATDNADGHESLGIADKAGETEIAECRRIQSRDTIPIK